MFLPATHPCTVLATFSRTVALARMAIPILYVKMMTLKSFVWVWHPVDGKAFVTKNTSGAANTDCKGS